MTGRPPAGRPPAGRVLFGLAIVVFALNMRPVFSSLAAVLPEIMRDTGASSLAAGLMTTLPVVCLGLFSPAAPWLAARLGVERTLLLVIAVTAGGSALRAFATEPSLLLGGPIAGAAIAVGNVLLPTLIKRDFPDRFALMTGLYSMAMCGGAALGAGFTVPLSHLSGGWPEALGLWALPALAAMALWLPFCLRPAAGGPGAGAVGGLWRERLAWQVTIFMGLQSALAYCVFGWMAPILRDRGITAEEAGFLTSASILAQVLASLATPFVATRGRDQRATCCGLMTLALIGLLGALFAPRWLIPVAILVQGIGQGGLFAAAMLLIIMRSPSPVVARHLSSMAQTIGYVIAAIGPFLVGVIRDATGSYGPTAFLFMAITAGAIWAALEAGRDRLVGQGRAGGDAIGAARPAE